MTDGPEARVGKEISVNLARPRSRTAVMDTPAYFSMRNEILEFLESHSKQFQH